MDLKYDIYTIQNSQGTGENRQYVRLVQHEPMTDKELEAAIQNRCSLTKGDVAAVLRELHDICVQEFTMGRRVHIPELGYFSLSASLEMPEGQPDRKITGKEVRLAGINFRPESSLMDEVERGMHFIRSEYTTQSSQYTEEKLLEKIKEYLEENRFITTRALRLLFGLTQYTAQKWLKYFCEKGIMVKDGTKHSPIYFLKATGEA